MRIQVKLRNLKPRYAGLLLCCSLALSACMIGRGLGARPSAAEQAQFRSLKQYDSGAFFNHPDYFNNPPPFARKKIRFTDIARFYLDRPAHVRPEAPLPAVDTDLRTAPPAGTEVTWFGHSSVLVRTAGATVLFDPVFGSSVGPVSGVMKAFAGADVDPSEGLNSIDAVVISHDHYDHLDFRTLRRLRKKIRRIIAPLGVTSHLRKWGFADSVITAVNWYDSVQVRPGLRLIATPAYHRSGRRFRENETLWASYVLRTGSGPIYFSGDTGYSGHFGAIGKQYGPFRLALLECGQYNEKWPHHHMFPEQTAQAGRDLNAAVVLPVHWAKFAESEHPWNEPVQRLLRAQRRGDGTVVVPLIGQSYTIGAAGFQQVNWWEMPWVLRQGPE